MKEAEKVGTSELCLLLVAEKLNQIEGTIEDIFMRGDPVFKLGQIATAVREAQDIVATAREEDCTPGLRAAVEDAVHTLESMDMHIDNPLYNRLRSAIE